jgi:hypothetical protein
MTTSSTVRAALMMGSPYVSAIAAVASGRVIAVIAPFAFSFAFMIPMWAGGSLWKSPLVIADAIS